MVASDTLYSEHEHGTPSSPSVLVVTIDPSALSSSSQMNRLCDRFDNDRSHQLEHCFFSVPHCRPRWPLHGPLAVRGFKKSGSSMFCLVCFLRASEANADCLSAFNS